MAGQYWALNTAGGYLSNSALSMKMRSVSQPYMRFRQFTEKQEDFGKHEGQILLFNKAMNVRTRGGRLAEGVPIPSTDFPLVQGTTTAYGFGNKINFTEELEEFSRFDLPPLLESRLIDDMAKAINHNVALQFQATAVMQTPTGSEGNPTSTWTTSGAIATAATRNGIMYDYKDVADALQRGVYGTATGAPVPAYDGDNYIVIGSVGALRKVKDDPEFQTASYYGDPERLFSGEVGRIYGLRFIADNSGELSHTLGTTAFLGESVVFGQDPVMEIVVVAEEIRRGIPSDLGRDRSIGWYAILGHQIIWSFNATTEPDNRIVHITST